MATLTPKKTKTSTNDLGQEFELEFKDVTYTTHAGSGAISLPDGMSLSEAVYWLKAKEKEQETTVKITEQIDGYPVDVAHALQLAVKEMFGIRELRSSGFFGERPPSFLSIPINVKGDMVEIFTGKFALPGIEGTIETGRYWNEALLIGAEIKQKSVPSLRKLLALTREILQKHSLYKGKAIRVGMTKEAAMFEEKITMEDPEFLDTSVMPAELMLNKDTRDLLTAAMWTPIERAEQTRFFGVALKRTVLLEGPYGTGKSLTALETARRAQANGWTFIYLKNVRDLKRVYPFAVRYAPSVMFAEDIDLIVKHADDDEENPDAVNMLNNVIDGVDSKQQDIILVLTTNHVERLPESLIRPGRFDTMVSFTRPDADTAVHLVRQYAGNNIDPADFNTSLIGELLAGHQPSTIHEIVKRAKLFSQQRYAADYRGPLMLATRDIKLSNDSMQAHLRLLNKPEEKYPSPMQQFGEVVGKYIEFGVHAAVQGAGPGPDSQLLNEEHRAELVRPAERSMTNGGEGLR